MDSKPSSLKSSDHPFAIPFPPHALFHNHAINHNEHSSNSSVKLEETKSPSHRLFPSKYKTKHKSVTAETLQGFPEELIEFRKKKKR